MCLTIGSKRKAFGLPMRIIDMAHDYKLAQVLDDRTNYIDWCKELDVWVELSEPLEEKKAVAIFSSLRGKTKEKKISEGKSRSCKIERKVRQGI